jgi:hypothetical protein
MAVVMVVKSPKYRYFYDTLLLCRLDYTHGGIGCDAGHNWSPAAYKTVRLSGRRGEKKAANTTDQAVVLPVAAASAPTVIIR